MAAIVKQYIKQGRRAHKAGTPRDACPFKRDDLVADWLKGWDQVEREVAEAKQRPAPVRPRRDAASGPRDEAAEAHRVRWYKVPQFPKAHYEVDVGWAYLERMLENWDETASGHGGLNMDPDYQRQHVWTREQQVAYVEYVLAGGEVGRNITWNSPDWMRGFQRPTELVDGKQRLEAVRSFLRGEFAACGMTAGPDDRFDIHCGFKFRVCTMDTREDVLRLYLNINAGGTPHAAAEIERVRGLLAETKS
jgi:ribosome modulation factor